MHPDLDRASAIIQQATAGMKVSEMDVHPEGKWSTADILEHLGMSFSATADVLTRCAEEGEPRLQPDRSFQRIAAWLVVDAGYFPTGREAPVSVRPRGRPAEQSLVTIGDALASLDAACEAAGGRFGLRAKVANHPILGQFSVRQWRRFHLVHTRHHAKQIGRLRGR